MAKKSEGSPWPKAPISSHKQITSCRWPVIKWHFPCGTSGWLVLNLCPLVPKRSPPSPRPRPFPAELPGRGVIYLLFPCHRILLIRNVFWRMVQLVNSVLPCKCWQHMMECRSRDLSVAMASVTAFLCFRSGMVMSTVKRCVNTIESIIDRRPTVSNNARALACLRHQKRPQDNHRHIQWSKRIT